jgi:hypothetical protein
MMKLCPETSITTLFPKCKLKSDPLLLNNQNSTVISSMTSVVFNADAITSELCELRTMSYATTIKILINV